TSARAAAEDHGKPDRTGRRACGSKRDRSHGGLVSAGGSTAQVDQDPPTGTPLAPSDVWRRLAGALVTAGVNPAYGCTLGTLSVGWVTTCLGTSGSSWTATGGGLASAGGPQASATGPASAPSSAC